MQTTEILIDGSPIRRTIINVAWLFVDNGLRLLFGLLVGVWMARYLGPTQIGQLNFTVAIVAIFAALAALGMNGSVVRRVITLPNSAPETLGSAFALQFIAGIVCAALVILFVYLYQPAGDSTVLLASILGSSLLFKPSEVFKYWFESQVSSRNSVLAEGAVLILCSGVKILLIAIKAPLVIFVWVIFAEGLLSLLALVFAYNKSGQSIRAWKYTRGTSRELLSATWPVIFSSALVALSLNADKVFLMSLSGPADLGMYSVASGLVAMWFIVPVAFGASIAPHLTQVYNSNRKEYLRLSRLAYLWLAGGSLVIATLVFLAAETIVVSMYGHSFGKAGNLLSIMIWGSVFVSIVSLRGRLLIIEAQQKYVPGLIFLGVATHILLLIALVPDYGSVGSAYAYVISWGLNALVFPLLLGRTRRHGKMALGFSGAENES